MDHPLDYLNNRPVAALVYHRIKHNINLFLWPVGKRTWIVPGEIDRQGYHLATLNPSWSPRNALINTNG